MFLPPFAILEIDCKDQPVDLITTIFVNSIATTNSINASAYCSLDPSFKLSRISNYLMLADLNSGWASKTEFDQDSLKCKTSNDINDF